MKHTVNTLRRKSVLIVIAAFLILYLPSLVMKYVWIDLRSVTVVSTVEGGVPTVLIDRDIKRDFMGGFNALVRDARTERVTCLGVPSGAFPYKKEASADSPYLRMTLQKWLRS